MRDGATRSQGAMAGAAVLLLALLLRGGALIVSDRVVADVERYQRVGRHLLDVSWNPYETKRLYPYPPVWAVAEAGAEWLSRRGLGTFAMNVKLPVLFADLLIVAALVAAGRAGRAPPMAAWIYAVHPVSVLITGFHGQFESLALLFILLSLAALSRGSRDASALLLAGAIAVKSFPVVLLPFLAMANGVGWRKALRYGILALAPVGLLLLPFAVADFSALSRELFAYSGIADFGWTGLVRGLSWLVTDELPRSEARFWPVSSLVSKVLFLSAWAALVVATLRGRLTLTPERTCLATLLAFHVLYGSQSAQYLLWVVPLGLLRPGALSAVHAVTAAAGLVGFYLFLAPGVLVPWPLEGSALVWAGRVWVCGVAATLGVSAVWLAVVLREGLEKPELDR